MICCAQSGLTRSNFGKDEQCFMAIAMADHAVTHDPAPRPIGHAETMGVGRPTLVIRQPKRLIAGAFAPARRALDAATEITLPV